MELFQKACALLEQCGDVMLASVSGQGFPRTCVVSKVKNDGLRSVWIATGSQSVKTVHFRANPRAGLCYYHGPDSVTMTGTVDVLESPDVKRSLWQEDFATHFPGGPDDPDYCILRFDGLEATFWVGGVLETHRLTPVQSRCGICCEQCALGAAKGCSRCIPSAGHPFYGECPVASCCQQRGHLFCGECGEFPCELLNRFAHDPEHGDNGQRIEQCRAWLEQVKNAPLFPL